MEITLKFVVISLIILALSITSELMPKNPKTVAKSLTIDHTFTMEEDYMRSPSFVHLSKRSSGQGTSSDLLVVYIIHKVLINS